MAFLQLNNLNVGYFNSNKSNIIQKDINLSAEKGELIALIGTNGCGKSTLLRSISCLQPVISGEVLLDGHDVLRMKPKKRATQISVVLTSIESVASFTVKELISIGRDPFTGWLGKLSVEDDEIIHKAIEVTHLQGFENRNIHQLSDGERQRVFIARAMAQDTPLMLLDEPTSHLDLPNRINTLLLLQKLAHQTSKTILISTHELETAMQVADKIWLMKKNAGVSVGTPEDLILTGKINTAFDSNNSGNDYIFDEMSGGFSINQQKSEVIDVEVNGGNELIRKWTIQALRKNGYNIVDNALIEILPDVETRSWQIRMGNKSTTVRSIEELIIDLKKHTHLK
ncbi:MAG: ABC transporter ATP-binding protein [Dysgonamonadaceae bacterium]|nr:ABC transporter ATP-binding protein [Dysgonamonadaceae bacterium]MDD3309301.1 ABC transporter ATP-binding protein [Dysgonamonadaceae bacterium]MDD3900631.1 ABC transporter ATP-binding protein [Dysgonamonadaceae bacterium]MDD4399091.1 ABC transporter ATP-binding protein [Dysgonamonadaceae bacterium]MEA5081472.1 ABC transporter ATP-binding protein [Dysgonamonadaceae bacterium]